MLNLLICIDGSESALRVVDEVIRIAGEHREKPKLHLLNVQSPFSGDISMFVQHEQIQAFHEKTGLEALERARAKLDAAKLPYDFKIEVGSPAQTIVQYAQESGCDQICMGSRGLGHVAGLLLGSVTAKVVHLSNLPVLLIT